MKQKTLFSLSLLFFLVVTNSCKEDEPPLPDNIIQFETGEQGFPDSEQEATVTLSLSRAAESATTVVIELSANGVEYGNEFTTQPAASDNSISISMPAGATEASFRITKANDIFLTGTESITFTIKSATTPVLVGNTKKLDVKFAAIISDGSQLTLNGLVGSEPGTSAGNAVFVDLSNNRQTPALRSAWDFGFYTGSDFRVILNNTTSAAAMALDKNDLKAVVAADTVHPTALNLNFEPSGFEIIDDVNGDLSKTVIAEVSATEGDNKVYIVNRGTGGGLPAKPWLKIRVLRKGTNGYTLQYAGINDTDFKTLDIEKDPDYNFVYVSCSPSAASTVQIEPKKSDWDIKWGYQMSVTPLGPGVLIPYPSSDFVTINNRAGVEAAEVLTSSVGYDAFSESHISSAEFKSDYDVIGTNWRVAAREPGGSAVKTDRFYVVKDSVGNVYKLKFLRYHGDEGGTRGKPELEYKLVKKGA